MCICYASSILHIHTCVSSYFALIGIVDLPQPGVGPVQLSLVSGSEEVEPTLMQLDRKEKMTYTEQAAKRKHCQRLTRSVSVNCILHNLTFSL